MYVYVPVAFEIIINQYMTHLHTTNGTTVCTYVSAYSNVIIFNDVITYVASYMTLETSNYECYRLVILLSFTWIIYGHSYHLILH